MKTIKNIGWIRLVVLSLSLTLSAGLFYSCQKSPGMKALIITGQSVHDWETSTEALEKIMENSELFTVEVAQSPSKGEDMSEFKPEFSTFDLVVLNYDGDSWSDELKDSFVEYVRNGGGVVVYHGASMAFPDWPEYNEITGLGGWGDRDENAGPYCYWKDGETVTENIPGEAGQHGDAHEFIVVHRDTEHPVLKGLPDSWLHGKDELYGGLRGPAKNLTILATAFSDTATGGTGRDEPVLFTVSFGNGRIFHDALGHPDPENDESALHCAGFIITFLRGAEWAVTGEVTQPIHPDFPNSASTFFWEDYQPVTLDELMTRIATYETGKSRKYLADLSNRIRKSDGTAETLLMFEKEMVKVCESDATAECKKQLCRELSWMGSESCIPTLEKLAEDPEVSEMAAYALERLTNQ
jgi:type 1 glutamine amidotransferase